MYQKKGLSLTQGFAAVLIVIVVAVLVIVAIFLFVTLQGSFPDVSESVINETTTSVVNETGVVISNAVDCGFGGFAVGIVTNATDGVLIPSSNYSTTALGAIACSSCSINFNNTLWNVTYSNTNKGAGCDASADMVTQFATYPALIGLVGVVIFLALVIGVLVSSFAFGGRRGI